MVPGKPNSCSHGKGAKLESEPLADCCLSRKALEGLPGFRAQGLEYKKDATGEQQVGRGLCACRLKL